MTTRPINISGHRRPNLSRFDRFQQLWVEPNLSDWARSIGQSSAGCQASSVREACRPLTRPNPGPSRGSGSLVRSAASSRPTGHSGSRPCPRSSPHSAAPFRTSPPSLCSSSARAETSPIPTTQAQTAVSAPNADRAPQRPSAPLARPPAHPIETVSTSPPSPSASPRSSPPSARSNVSAARSANWQPAWPTAADGSSTPHPQPRLEARRARRSSAPSVHHRSASRSPAG